MLPRTAYLVIAFAAMLIFISFTACAPIKEFGDGVGRTVDKLVHPREW